MINESLAETFGWATPAQLAEMKSLTYRVNEVLKQLFADGGLLLVDYKLEFGLFHGSIVLGDEFSPDGCRLWDAKTREKLDKDRFRQGLGGVIEAYEEVGSASASISPEEIYTLLHEGLRGPSAVSAPELSQLTVECRSSRGSPSAVSERRCDPFPGSTDSIPGIGPSLRLPRAPLLASGAYTTTILMTSSSVLLSSLTTARKRTSTSRNRTP